MFNLNNTFKTLVFPILIISFTSCGSENPIEELVSDSESMSWTANDVDFESLESEVFGININGLFLIGEDASEWGIYMDLGKGAVTSGQVYNLDEDSDLEMYLYDNRGSRWSSKNPGGSATVTMTSYTMVDNMLFVDAIAEGTFSGTLTLKSDTTVCNVSNGVFKVEL